MCFNTENTDAVKAGFNVVMTDSLRFGFIPNIFQ